MSEHRMIDVFMVTYNHEAYISQAIESVLMQSTEYSYRLIISDDCSTDKTREIIHHYQQRYPDKIELWHNDRNIGAQRNFAKILGCTAKYVAILDGDDYWTSPHKLQQQIDFLENHEDHVICFHRVDMIWDDGSGKWQQLPQFGGEKDISIHDLFNDYFMPTSSIVYRNGLISEFPDWFYSLTIGDRPLNILNAHFGKIKGLDPIMGVYRIHPGGIWSMTREGNKEKLLEQKIRMMEAFDTYFNGQYHAVIAGSMAKFKLVLCAHRLTENRMDDVFELLLNEKEQMLKRLAGKNLAIFGTGEFAKDTYQIFRELKIPVKMFLDNDPRKRGSFLYNIPVENTEVIDEGFAVNHLIVIASMYFSEIQMQLEQLGLRQGEHFLQVQLFFEPCLY